MLYYCNYVLLYNILKDSPASYIGPFPLSLSMICGGLYPPRI